MHAGYIRRLLDIFPDVAFSLDANGQIVAANRRACANLGYDVADLEGRPLAEFTEQKGSAVADIVKLWRGTNGPLPASLRLRSRNGEVVSYQANGGNVATAGEPANLIVRCVDKKKSIAKFVELTQTIAALSAELHNRRALEIALRNAKDAAEIADRTKSQFLANMSHELRTPLNAIIGFSQVMKAELIGPMGNVKYQEYSRDINGAGLHVLNLVNDILDLSKVEANKDELYEENIELPTVLKSVISLVQQRAKTNNVRLTVEIGNEISQLRADQRKLTQILLNLLTNATKYNKPGGTVTIRAWSRQDSGFVLQVADTGIGIAPEDIPKALELFGQVKNGFNRTYEGTGIGLPLTKALVELHGGSLNVESEMGTGTTVTVRFPAWRIVSESASVA